MTLKFALISIHFTLLSKNALGYTNYRKFSNSLKTNDFHRVEGY